MSATSVADEFHGVATKSTSRSPPTPRPRPRPRTIRREVGAQRGTSSRPRAGRSPGRRRRTDPRTATRASRVARMAQRARGTRGRRRTPGRDRIEVRESRGLAVVVALVVERVPAEGSVVRSVVVEEPFVEEGACGEAKKREERGVSSNQPPDHAAAARTASATRSTSASVSREWNGSASARSKQASAPGKRPLPRYALSRWRAYVPICASIPCARSASSFVPAVEPDDVRLPAVLVARVGVRRLDRAAQPVRVGGGHTFAAAEQRLKRCTCGNPDRTEHVRQPVVRARPRDVEVAVRLDPW